MSKLALLDGDGLNALAAKAGVGGQLFPPGETTNVTLGVFRSMTLSYQWMGEVVDSDTGSARTKYGVCGPEDGSVLPKKWLCGIPMAGSKRAPPFVAIDARRDGIRTGGFAFWGNGEAREKIFREIFKGYGPGPGTPPGKDKLADNPPGRDMREGSRALQAATEQVERMKEVVAMMQGKITG